MVGLAPRIVSTDQDGMILSALCGTTSIETTLMFTTRVRRQNFAMHKLAYTHSHLDDGKKSNTSARFRAYFAR